MGIEDIVSTLKHSASLVKAWGDARLPDGQTLAELLTFSEIKISLWDVVATEMALYHVPKVLYPGARPPSWAQQVKPRLSWGKHAALDLLTIRRSSQGCAQWPPAPVLLFLGFSSYMYRDVLQPVVTRLKEDNVVHPVTLYDGRRFGTIVPGGDGKGCQSIWQHWDGEVEAQARALGKAFKKALAELRAMRALPTVIQDQGRPLWPLLKAKFDWLFRVHLPRLLPQAAVARHILEQHRPSLIISPDVADPRTRLYTLQSRELGTPSLEIQFGMCGAEATEWQFLVADCLAAWGDQAREVLLAQGVPPEKIIVTGSPRHDSLVNEHPCKVAQIRARLGVPEGQAMVLFASSYAISDYDEMTSPASLAAIKKTIFQAAQRVSGITLVVKPHPLEDVEEIRKHASGCRNLLFAGQHTDIRELTKACDAFITLGTAATMDALILNKLVLYPAFPELVWWDDAFLKSGSILVLRSLEEIALSLKMIIDGSREKLLADLQPERQRFLKEWVCRIDGQAAARIALLAIEMSGLKREMGQERGADSTGKDSPAGEARGLAAART